RETNEKVQWVLLLFNSLEKCTSWNCKDCAATDLRLQPLAPEGPSREKDDMCPERTHPRLVGAAGFEPTTCSTQNCRATRLRYTPILCWEMRRYTLKPLPARRSGRAQRLLKSGCATRSPG